MSKRRCAQCARHLETIARLDRLVADQQIVIERQAKLIAEQQRRIGELEEQVQILTAQVQFLEKRILGPKSERMPEIARQLKPEDAEAAREAALKLRRLRAALKEKLATEKIHHPVEPEKRTCPKCGRTHLAPLGDGKKSVIFEYVPGHFVRQEHTQETLACACGEYVATADPPPKVVDKGRFGPGFIAHLITMKCADSLPIYRLAKQYQRIGIPMARSTMTDLFHVAAELLTPLSDRLLALIAAHEIVQADETSLKMQRENKRGFVWTFLAGDLIAYKFSGDRSGATPLAVLGGTTGTLVIDAYTGYNIVLDVDGRTRAGCIAHVRRKLFDALATAPEAKVGLEIILDVYRVEHEAKARGIVRSNLHLELRRTKARAAMDRLHLWLLEQQGRHTPKSPMGTAVSYALNQWTHLTRFLENARIPIDNNASERALRVVALGRKNFMHVGHEVAGQHLATLYSLVATCEAHEVDPIAYLADVLMRIQSHPASRIDELLPHKWVPPPIAERLAA